MLQSSRVGCRICYQHVSNPRLTLSGPRLLHTDSRQRLTSWWIPTGGVSSTSQDAGSALLVRAGLLRQAYSGIFHLLPLGLRIQDKLEAMVDKHMRSVGASKLALSTLSSQRMWKKSGRFDKSKAQLFRFEDRRHSKYLLSPTHEEEITALVSGMVQSPKDLPLRLYQITRKYRDELRPRGGLLRSREFLMKDLYTFDKDAEEALTTYRDVKQAYHALFADLKVPVLVAAADSGDMGGSLSHEFHMASQLGEDTIISCGSCDYVANEEVALPGKPVLSAQATIGRDAASTWVGISADRKTLIVACYPKEDGSAAPAEINAHTIKQYISDLDTSVSTPLDLWAANAQKIAENNEVAKELKIVRFFDYRVKRDEMDQDFPPPLVDQAGKPLETTEITHAQPLDLLRLKTGSTCPRCSSDSLEVQKAVEVGHVFHLGTRYSKVFGAVTDQTFASNNPEVAPTQAKIPIEMGCHGIGISRLIGLIANQLCDSKGLNWPKAIAPFQAVVIAGNGSESDAEAAYDSLTQVSVSSSGQQVDAVIDDRPRELVWKMKDADLLGIPILVVLGRSWQKDGTYEVQCRRSGKPARFVQPSELENTVRELLEEL